MKKSILTLCMMIMLGTSFAQEVNTYSVYDTNQSGDITVSDVTEVVDKVKRNVAASTTQQYVTGEELKSLFTVIIDKLNSIESRLSAIESKVGIENPDESKSKDPVYEEITIKGQKYQLGVSGAIDLGLDVKWSAFNLGATTPYEYGDYYAWGETEPYYTDGHSQDNPCSSWKTGKTGYNSDSYFDYIDGSSSNPNKYGPKLQTILDIDDDAAHVNWGGDWRMPSKQDIDDLRTKCTWVWSSEDGHYGYMIIGTTGNVIFLPCAKSFMGSSLQGSSGSYWSTSVNDNEYQPYYAYYLSISYKDINSCNANLGLSYRHFGNSIRAVCK